MTTHADRFEPVGSDQANSARALLVGDGELWVLTEQDLLHAVRSGLAPETPIASLAHPAAGLCPVSGTVSLLDAAALMLHPESAHVDASSSSGEAIGLSLRSGRSG